MELVTGRRMPLLHHLRFGLVNFIEKGKRQRRPARNPPIPDQLRAQRFIRMRKVKRLIPIGLERLSAGHRAMPA